MGKVNRSSYIFHNIYIMSSATVVGYKEHLGPLSDYYDKYYEDFLANEEKTFEKAEISMLKEAVNISVNKARLTNDDINVAYSGDLTNQIVISSYAYRDLGIPYVGLFGACSTAILGMIMSAIYLENSGGYAVCSTSSHNCTAERQFRYPTEYGTQRANTYTSTVTGASSIVVSTEKRLISITKATIGKVIDMEMKDPQDMGRAMAPAAYHTIKKHFDDFNLSVDDYDLIVTGDLSTYGKQMLIDLFKMDNIDIENKYEDCGLLVYDKEEQDVLAGGSGTGCVGIVLSGYIMAKMKERKYKRVLVCGTGALMNPMMLAQKETIPAISHVISLEVVE